MVHYINQYKISHSDICVQIVTYKNNKYYKSYRLELNYAAEVAGIPPGPAVIRCIILLWTGDYPAQSEVGKFINGGVRPCRRCKVAGMLERCACYHVCIPEYNQCSK